MFALTYGPGCPSVVALGDGSAEYGSGNTVVRVTPERAMTRLHAPTDVGLVAAERSGGVVMASRWGRTVWRVTGSAQT